MLLQCSEKSCDYIDKMLANNEIPGLVPGKLRFFNDNRQFCFDLGQFTAIKEAYERTAMSAKAIEQLVTKVIDIIDGGRPFLLKENDFILSPEYIFLNQEDYEVRLCYLPGYGEPLKKQFSLLFDYMMNHVDYTDQKAVVFAYMLYNKSREENCTFLQLKKSLKEYDEKKFDFTIEKEEETSQTADAKSYKPKDNTMERTPFLQSKSNLGGSYGNKTFADLEPSKKVEKDTQDKKEKNVFQKIAAILFQGELKEKKERKAAATILDYPINQEHGWTAEPPDKAPFIRAEGVDYEEARTVLLNGSVMACCFCLRPVDKRGSDIIVTTSPFYIGKEDANVNAGLPDKTVSRLHAKITVRQEQCYLEDLHSTNGSYVNGERIDDGPILLSLGDEVAFADKKYIFQKL